MGIGYQSVSNTYKIYLLPAYKTDIDEHFNLQSLMAYMYIVFVPGTGHWSLYSSCSCWGELFKRKPKASAFQIRYACSSSILGVGFSIWRHTFKMAAMTPFHAEKHCHLVSLHAVSALSIYSSVCKFLNCTTFVLVKITIWIKRLQGNRRC